MKDPLEKAISWTNLILEHGGVPHVRSPARNMNMFQLMSMDVMLFLCAISYLLFKVLKYVTYRITHLIITKKAKED